MLQLFFERLKPKPPTIHRFRAPKSTSNRYVQGERPHACKRPRWTAKSHASLREAINQFQTMLNTVYSNEAPIYVENKVDLECPPNDFQPIRDYVPHKDVFLPTKAVVGCQCAKNLKPKIGSGTELCWVNRHSGCCAINSGARVPYNLSKKLLVPPGHPVFECNSTCGCGPTCPFRVVQLGRKVPLTVFRTSNGRGWGVKAAERIPKGTFVCEYIGEIITFEEAEQRGQSYDKQRMTYLFDLDFDGETHYTVDAFQMGNVSHFINHSCNPNLTVRCTFIECLNTELPRLALFASRNISRNEEITFDYQMTGELCVRVDHVRPRPSVTRCRVDYSRLLPVLPTNVGVFVSPVTLAGALDSNDENGDISEVSLNTSGQLEADEAASKALTGSSRSKLPSEGSSSADPPDNFSEVRGSAFALRRWSTATVGSL
ncbi:unnamed protein product [Mesocestoides corti]|uniref:Histone-lysine N-methyltransferase n=1 Tax=Mesocestoides corti TaxID=53468 RepID=A0A3P6HER3_MESCO|nr:unnamed protein product [Mesocestoides corti]